MSGDSDSEYVRLEVSDSESIGEVVLAFRQDDQLHELAKMRPPVEATLEKPDS